MVNRLAKECKSLEELQSKYSDLLMIPAVTERQPLLTVTQTEAFFEKLKNRMLLIPVIGTGSAGKTTLLDAILGEKFVNPNI